MLRNLLNLVVSRLFFSPADQLGADDSQMTQCYPEAALWVMKPDNEHLPETKKK